MDNSKMTAEERVRRAAVYHGYPLEQAYPITSLEVSGDVVVRLMEEHASEAVKNLEARVAELEAKRYTYCAYCDYKEENDPDSLGLAQHIAQCKKHPMRRVERERDAAREIVYKMEIERLDILERLDKLARERDQLREDIDRCAQVKWYGLIESARREVINAHSSAGQNALRVAELERELYEARARVETLEDRITVAARCTDRVSAQALIGEQLLRERAEQERNKAQARIADLEAILSRTYQD